MILFSFCSAKVSNLLTKLAFGSLSQSKANSAHFPFPTSNPKFDLGCHFDVQVCHQTRNMSLFLIYP